MKKRYSLIGFILILTVAGLAITVFDVIYPVDSTATESHDHHDHEQACAHGTKSAPADFFDDLEHDTHTGKGDHPQCSTPFGKEKVVHHAGHDHDAHGANPGDICPEHGIPEIDDALCHGDRIGDLPPGKGMKVRLASPDAAARAGVRIVTPQQIFFSGSADIPSRVTFNRNRLARITPLASGVVRQVHVQPGTKIAMGSVLVQIATPEVAALKAELLAARARQIETKATYLREKNLLDRGITSRQEFQQSESAYREALSARERYRQQLLNFGFSPKDIDAFLHNGINTAALSLRMPFDGTVVSVDTAVGEAVAPGTPLFTVADLDSLWIEMSIAESRIYQVQMDAPIQARFDGLPGMVFAGRIFHVGAMVDERTRTLKALAEVKNPDHRLRVGMFGNARISLGDQKQVLAVPAGALQGIDGHSYVFISEGPDLFELRRVLPGVKENGTVAILAGLYPGEKVVTTQGFALKSEVLKARLGASCADH